jgi:wyosine [tRNA(Phe)-imidazoG37] synthetase (radical SAM superfamily)
MLLELQGGIIYGPVHSRRLGLSLGVNVLPSHVKYCALDCLYCQYGWTGAHGLEPGPVELPTIEKILDAVKTALLRVHSHPAYVTFSGNGEPTLHPDFPAIVEGVRELRDRHSPGSRVAVLSNSTTVSDERVRGALARLDLRVMKLDAGTEETFLRFNRPCAGVSYANVVDGLAKLADVTIQALFAGGAGGNAAPDHVDAWVETLRRIAPAMVQIYSLDRGFPSREIEPIPQRDLVAIARKLDAAGLRASVY